MKLDYTLNEYNNFINLLKTHADIDDVSDFIVHTPPAMLYDEDLSELDNTNINDIITPNTNAKIIVRDSNNEDTTYTVRWRRIDLAKQWELAGGGSYQDTSIDIDKARNFIKSYIDYVDDALDIILDDENSKIFLRSSTESTIPQDPDVSGWNSLLYFGEIEINYTIVSP